MNAAPKISIGLAVYNGEKYLAAAIDCFLEQTHADFELIIFDNASTDDTEAICREYVTRDSRVSYHRQETNIGANGNFNDTFALARGEYFKWAAADDICAPTYLERCCEALDRDASIVWCHSISAKIDAKGRPITQPPDNSRARRGEDCRSPQAHLRYRDVLLKSGHWGIRLSGMFRTEMLRRTQLLGPYYGCDKILCAEVALAGRYEQIPETLFFQRIHDEASSNLATAEEQQEFACPGHRVKLPRLKILSDFINVAWATPISRWQRMLCFLWVGCYLFQLRKWPGVLRKLWLGRGVGAGELELLEQVKSRGTKRTPVESPEPRHAERPPARVAVNHQLVD